MFIIIPLIASLIGGVIHGIWGMVLYGFMAWGAVLIYDVICQLYLILKGL